MLRFSVEAPNQLLLTHKKLYLLETSLGTTPTEEWDHVAPPASGTQLVRIVALWWAWTVLQEITVLRHTMQVGDCGRTGPIGMRAPLF